MSQAPVMPVFTDALLGDTLHLTAEEFGAYLLLLFATWRNNGAALPDDPKRLARTCRVSEARWSQKLRPVLAEFFDVEAGKWRQGRLEKEWEIVAKRKAIFSEKGKKSVSARALKNNETTSTAVLSKVASGSNYPYPYPKERVPDGTLYRPIDAAATGTEFIDQAADADDGARRDRPSVDNTPKAIEDEWNALWPQFPRTRGHARWTDCAPTVRLGKMRARLR